MDSGTHTFVSFTGRQDVLPALLHTLAPPVRPVIERLLQPSERAALADVTDSMLAYGLRYAPPAPVPVFSQQQSAAPATNLPLKPAVDRLCAYQVSITWHLPNACCLQELPAKRFGAPHKGSNMKAVPKD